MAVLFCRWYLGTLLLLVSLSAAAQTDRVTYEFMTVSVIKSPYQTDCYLLLTPAFQGKTQIKLEEEYNLASDRYRTNLQHNITLLNETLGGAIRGGVGPSRCARNRGGGRAAGAAPHGHHHAVPAAQSQKISCCV
jgi:hypothetical protein